MSSDDSQVGAAALSLSSLSSNTPFLSQDMGKGGNQRVSMVAVGFPGISSRVSRVCDFDLNKPFSEKEQHNFHVFCHGFDMLFSTSSSTLVQASSALGESSLSVSVTGNLSAVDGASAEVVVQLMTTTTTTSSSSSSSSSWGR